MTGADADGAHAQKLGMRQSIEAVQPEQHRGPQQLVSEQTLLDEGGRQPAWPRDGGQQQGVDPDDEAEREAGQRALARAALPEDAADNGGGELRRRRERRSEEHTSELQSLMRISYAVFCLKKKTQQ